MKKKGKYLGFTTNAIMHMNMSSEFQAAWHSLGSKIHPFGKILTEMATSPIESCKQINAPVNNSFISRRHTLLLSKAFINFNMLDHLTHSLPPQLILTSLESNNCTDHYKRLKKFHVYFDPLHGFKNIVYHVPWFHFFPEISSAVFNYSTSLYHNMSVGILAIKPDFWDKPSAEDEYYKMLVEAICLPELVKNETFHRSIFAAILLIVLLILISGFGLMRCKNIKPKMSSKSVSVIYKVFSNDTSDM
ncbi:hypothetical protein L596_017191 [Steinernema carpocapsae]|uniref:Uncharacterized protein n=1 Tax=Steinernema carpocapsae TaxID=34508 RepID=A0A4V6A1Q6_STECR|nr:hypothetical protein L596_017191 [Steinernema carpocapsae]